MQKKAKNFLQIAKINMQKKQKIIFQNKMQKKDAKKKMQKKRCKKKMQKRQVGCMRQKVEMQTISMQTREGCMINLAYTRCAFLMLFLKNYFSVFLRKFRNLLNDFLSFDKGTITVNEH